jgi:hypothetical protein
MTERVRHAQQPWSLANHRRLSGSRRLARDLRALFREMSPRGWGIGNSPPAPVEAQGSHGAQHSAAVAHAEVCHELEEEEDEARLDVFLRQALTDGCREARLVDGGCRWCGLDLGWVHHLAVADVFW